MFKSIFFLTTFIMVNSFCMEQPLSPIAQEYNKTRQKLDALHILNNILNENPKLKPIREEVRKYLEIIYLNTEKEKKMIENFIKPEISKNNKSATSPIVSPTFILDPLKPTSPHTPSSSPNITVSPSFIFTSQTLPHTPPSSLSPSFVLPSPTKKIIYPTNTKDQIIVETTPSIGIAAFEIICKSETADQCIGLPLHEEGYINEKKEIKIIFGQIDKEHIELLFTIPGKEIFTGEINKITNYEFQRNNTELNKELQYFVQLVHTKIETGTITNRTINASLGEHYEATFLIEGELTEVTLQNIDTPQAVITGKTRLRHEFILNFKKHYLPIHYAKKLKEINAMRKNSPLT